jgi:sugar phosphate isomerase/epimerase
LRLAFSNLGAPRWSLERTLEAVGEYGYDGVELRLIDGEPIAPLDLTRATRHAVRRALDRAEVPLVCLDTSIQLARLDERELNAALELAHDWGAPTVRVFGGTLNLALSPSEACAEILVALQGPLDLAHRLGITIALETHDDFSSAAAVAALLQSADNPSLGALWDVHHPYRLGESPGQVLGLLGERIVFVHVKDARRSEDGWELVLLGEGDVPVAESLAALRRTGYTGWVSVEWEKRWHPELDEPEIALPQHAQLLRRWLREPV